MALTWEELQAQLVDLGFEEDEITTEYGRIMRNAVNRSLDIIYATVVPQIDSYYKLTASWGYADADGNWKLPKPKHVTTDTEGDAKMGLADNLHPLIPLLAAHYLWLDDDIEKATLYWNEYDQLKDQIITVCRQPRSAVIEGGVSF